MHRANYDDANRGHIAAKSSRNQSAVGIGLCFYRNHREKHCERRESVRHCSRSDVSVRRHRKCGLVSSMSRAKKCMKSIVSPFQIFFTIFSTETAINARSEGIAGKPGPSL